MSIIKHQGAPLHDIHISSLPPKITSFLGHSDNTFLLHIYYTPLMILKILPHWLTFGIHLCKLYAYGPLGTIVQNQFFSSTSNKPHLT